MTRKPVTPTQRQDISSLYKRWSGLAERPKPSFLAYIRATNPWLFAHHPPHACFREHVWKINGLYICKGCLSTYAGLLVGLAFQLASGWLSWFDEPTLIGLFYLLLLPTVLTGIFRAPRPARLVSRFTLGVLIASACSLLIISNDLITQLVVLVNFFVVRFALEKVRRRQNAAHLRQQCGEEPRNSE